MKRVALVILTLTLIALPMFAQPQPQHPDPVGVVAHVLELSQEQITAWIDILHARQTAIQPLAEQAQEHQKAIGTMLASPTPDPQALGIAMIELRTIQQQIGEISAQSAKQFEQLLTPEQLQKLNGIRGGAQVCPIVPAFQATGLL